MNIDAHQHFWKYQAAGYPWINDSMEVLRRDFLPRHLKQEIDQVGIDGLVSVQARQTIDETQWLLDLADEQDFIKGVVGWVPLAAADLRSHLAAFVTRPKLKAVRHVLQDEPDERFIERDDFNAGIAALKDYGLAYDLLIYERQLPRAIELVDRHPNQVFVLDHLAKPRAKEHDVEPWRTNIHRLAERQHVFCKLSGLVTEADWQHWTEGQVSLYLGTVLEAFSPKRVMFGSDWPVCLLACTYGKWYDLVSRFCSSLSADEQRYVFGRTAAAAYNL